MGSEKFRLICGYSNEAHNDNLWSTIRRRGSRSVSLADHWFRAGTAHPVKSAISLLARAERKLRARKLSEAWSLFEEIIDGHVPPLERLAALAYLRTSRRKPPRRAQWSWSNRNVAASKIRSGSLRRIADRAFDWPARRAGDEVDAFASRGALRNFSSLKPLNHAAHEETISSGFERPRELMHFGSGP
jgi:hypothetical protein